MFLYLDVIFMKCVNYVEHRFTTRSSLLGACIAWLYLRFGRRYHLSFFQGQVVRDLADFHLEMGSKKAKVQLRTCHEVPERVYRYCVYSYFNVGSVLVGGDGHRHVSAALTPRKRPGRYCIGGWLGPRAGPELRDGKDMFSARGVFEI